MQITKKRIIGLIISIIIWTIGLMFEDWVKEKIKVSEKMTIHISIYTTLITVGLIITLISLMIFWAYRDFKQTIFKMKSQIRFLSAIYFENRNLGNLNRPTRDAALEAGLTIEDLVSVGMTEQEAINLLR